MLPKKKLGNKLGNSHGANHTKTSESLVCLLPKNRTQTYTINSHYQESFTNILYFSVTIKKNKI